MKLEKWRLRATDYDHTKVTALWLYPELECSACVDDCDGNGQEQLAYYCRHIRRKYPQWWDADAVPIYWFVRGDDDGFGCEFAPWHDGENVLMFYRTPISVRTGEPINWYRLPVINRRFPKFAAALGWLPSPGQMFAPLRSIIRGASDRRCKYPAAHRMARARSAA
jgi:hypothetical protein